MTSKLVKGTYRGKKPDQAMIARLRREAGRISKILEKVARRQKGK